MDVLSFSDLHLGHYLSGGDVKQEVSDYFSAKKKQLEGPAYPLKGVLGVGKLSKKLFNFLDPEEFDYDAKLMTVNGDLIDAEVDKWAKKNTLELYNQLTSDDDLDKKLVAYKSELEGEFDLVADKAEVLSEIYADLHFKEDLIEGSGIYSMILKELESLAKKKGVKAAFVLGNHDLAYELFKPRFNKMGLKNVKFVDRDVVEIGDYCIAGFGGSPEQPSGSLSKLLNVYSSDEAGNSRLEQALEEFKEKDLKGVDLFLTHKGPNCGQVFNPKFQEVMSGLVSEISPKYLLMGHMHDGLVSGNVKYFNDFDGVKIVNPGQNQFIGLGEYLDPVIINDSGKHYVKELLAPKQKSASKSVPKRKPQDSLPQGTQEIELTPELLANLQPQHFGLLTNGEVKHAIMSNPELEQGLMMNPYIQRVQAQQQSLPSIERAPPVQFENPALNQQPLMPAPMLG